jgi:YfiH family protein
MYRQPRWKARFPHLVVAESTRLGGVSAAPFASLNLGLYTSDALENVRENRRRLVAALGLDINDFAGSRQVHGSEILIVEAPGQYEGYDALIAARAGIALTVTVADCAPVLIYDVRREVVAAVHAGWRGTAAGIVEKTLARMRDAFGVDPADCFAYIGACIDDCSFEVDADVARHFSEAFKRWAENRGKFLVDLKGANQAQLRRAGVPKARIEISPYSTVLHNDRFFSYRKEGGQTGRALGLIALR